MLPLDYWNAHISDENARLSERNIFFHNDTENPFVPHEPFDAQFDLVHIRTSLNIVNIEIVSWPRILRLHEIDECGHLNSSFGRNSVLEKYPFDK